MYINIHSSAGDTCLVDFILGNDSFTVLLSTDAAWDLIKLYPNNLVDRF